jgi:hypothetical protein
MKYLMIIVVLFEELFNKIPKPKIKVKDLGNLFFIFIFPSALLLFIGWVSLTALQIILVITFILIFFMALITISDGWNKEFSMMIINYIISGIIFFNLIQTETISELKNVNITENTIQYKGFTEDVKCKREKCSTKKYNIEHYKIKLYGISQEKVSVTCVEAPKKVQKIQEIKEK